MIDGSRIRPGDIVLGLASDGLHTNGYSLARKILFEDGKLSLASRLPGFALPLGRELLRVHRNYQPLMAKLPRDVVKGAAHITGGGLIDNLPRVLPSNCDAVIDTNSWKVAALFQHLQAMGSVPRNEMYQVFNMGIGMTLIVAEKHAASVAKQTKARRIGRIEKGSGVTRLD